MTAIDVRGKQGRRELDNVQMKRYHSEDVQHLL